MSDDAIGRDGASDGVAVDAGRLLAEPLEEAGGVAGLAAGIVNGLAVLPGDEGGNVLGVVRDLVVPCAQQLGALAAGLGSEGREGVGGGADGRLGILTVEVGSRADEFPGSRVCESVHQSRLAKVRVRRHVQGTGLPV